MWQGRRGMVTCILFVVIGLTFTWFGWVGIPGQLDGQLELTLGTGHHRLVGPFEWWCAVGVSVLVFADMAAIAIVVMWDKSHPLPDSTDRTRLWKAVGLAAFISGMVASCVGSMMSAM